MTEPPSTTDNLAAARRCLEIYGGDIARWPEDARARWGDIALSDALKDERAEADALDALLGAATAPSTPHDLKNRIEASYRPPTERPGRGRFWDGLSSLAGWMRPLPAGALASLSVLGFAAGAAIDADDRLTPEYEAYAYLEDSGLVAFEEETGALWDAE